MKLTTSLKDKTAKTHSIRHRSPKSPMSVKELEFVVKNRPVKKTSGQTASLGKDNKHWRESCYQFYSVSSTMQKGNQMQKQDQRYLNVRARRRQDKTSQRSLREYEHSHPQPQPGKLNPAKDEEGDVLAELRRLVQYEDVNQSNSPY